MVGRALAARLADLGHDVVIGTRDPGRTLSRTEPGNMGAAPFPAWQENNPGIRLMSFADAGRFAEVVLNATAGAHSLAALEAIGAEALADKVLLDLAIPLDLSQGMPPTLLTANSDSLGEQIQRAFPDTRVVKSLHTVYYEVMIDPARLPGDHCIFVAGNDEDAKQIVRRLLQEFEWPDQSIIDLGDIGASRATEMYSRLFFALYAQFGSFDINVNIVRA